MSESEQDLVARFLDGLGRQRVVDFIGAVVEDEALMSELSLIDLDPESVAAFAREKGYGFSSSELIEVIEARIAAEIPEAELAIRAKYLDERAQGIAHVPREMNEDTDACVRDVTHAPDFELPRAAILQGDVIALRKPPALPTLLALMEEALDAAFDGTELEQIHEHHNFEDMKARAEVAYDRLVDDTRVPGAMQAVIRDLGFDPQKVWWEWPGMRLLFPVEYGGRGVYRTANSGALAAHRDTWYGSPQHQLNFWGPIKRLDPDATLRIYSRYHRKTVANSSYGYDTWQNQAGIALPPSITDGSISPEGAFAPPLEVGDALCFSGHQLHASAVNRSGRTRVSFEFRLLHADDEGQFYVPSNTDYYGIGEIYRGWYDQNGDRVDRLTGEITPR